MHLRPSPFCQFLGAPPPFYCPALALRVSQLSQGLQPPQLGKSGDAPGFEIGYCLKTPITAVDVNFLLNRLQNHRLGAAHSRHVYTRAIFWLS